MAQIVNNNNTSEGLTPFPPFKVEITTSKIKECLDSLGIECEEGLSSVPFRYEEENWLIITDSIPMITLVKRYSLEEEDRMIANAVASDVTSSGRLAHCIIEDDDEGNAESITFIASWVELSIDHFKQVLREYITIVNNAVGVSRYYFNRYNEDSKQKIAAERYPDLEQ